MGADELQTIPARHGVATFVPKGQTIKIVNTSGTQVIDTWAFALPAPPKQSTAAEQKQAEEAVAQAKEDIAAAVQAQDEDKKEEQVSGEAQIQEQKSDDQTQSGAQEEEEKTETGKSEAQAQDEGNPDLGDQTDGQGESKSSVPGASSIPGASTVGVAASSVTNAASSVGSAASNAVGMGATKDEGAPDPPEEVPSTDKPSAQKAGGKKAGVFSDEDAASMAALSGSQVSQLPTIQRTGSFLVQRPEDHCLTSAPYSRWKEPWKERLTRRSNPLGKSPRQLTRQLPKPTSRLLGGKPT